MPSLLADPASTVGTCILVETDAAVAFPGASVDASLPTPAPWPTSSRHAPPPGSHPTTDPDRSESERRSPPQTNHSERTSRRQTLFAPPRVRSIPPVPPPHEATTASAARRCRSAFDGGTAPRQNGNPPASPEGSHAGSPTRASDPSRS